jgi:hypothetical protein
MISDYSSSVLVALTVILLNKRVDPYDVSVFLAVHHVAVDPVRAAGHQTRAC